jgi:hypothetical protein
MMSGRVQSRLTGRVHGRFGAIASVLALSAALPLLLGGCSSDEPATGQTQPKQATHRDFDPANFSDPTRIDNKWYPLSPGLQFVYEGRSDRGHGRQRHQVIFTVTDLTKEIAGVRSVVMWDRDINAGRLLEEELAFHAQDDDGNVWNMGEYPEEREPGEPVQAPSTWIAGIGDAKAGVLMRGDPRVGTSSYRQGFVPSIEFGDVARVFKTGARDCVPTGCYSNVLITDETNPYEPADGHQRKFYAPGVGNTRAAPKGGKEKEVLVLVRVRRLGPQELAKVRQEAVELDRNAYKLRKKLWSQTPPVERASGEGAAG